MKKALLKQVGLWMLAMVMLFAFAATAFAASETESNNTLATANAYNYGEGAGGFVNDSDTVDYWKINNVPMGSHMLNGYSAMSMSVLSSGGSVIATKPVGVSSISFSTGSTGPIYVVVNYNPGSGIYYYGYSVN
ncbi:hypothetical protein ACFPPD_17850 [Cohnella suwonensis]|uniref:Uncharacterized protein n=1 Tax=Cohnella suwonensis TaxID=696072 RepID=A0ABW0LXN8_9BACL